MSVITHKKRVRMKIEQDNSCAYGKNDIESLFFFFVELSQGYKICTDVHYNVNNTD